VAKQHKLKVCILTSVHKPFDVRIFYRQAITLAQCGHRVMLLAHADFDSRREKGVFVKGIARPRNRFFRLLNLLRFLSKSLNEKAGVYHFHDFELLPIGLALKMLTKKTVFYDCHENYPETAYERVWLPDRFKPLLVRIIAWFEPTVARRLDCVICVVPDQQQRFISAGCRTTLIRNVPRLEMFESVVRQNLPKENRIIYLGGLTVVRGARLLVDIMAEVKKTHPHIKLLCLGPFNESYVEREVKNYIKERQVDDVIEHIPFVAHESVPDYLVRSKIGLLPWQPNQQMLKMVFPNKVLEYMACGLPIVASDIPSMKYLISEAQSGILVKADDFMEHAKAIRFLLDHREEMERLGAAGRAFVHKKYSWATEEKKLIELYQNFTGTSH
jgi:glycosyltransferase involved in cell wall biosynthesis